MRFSYDWNNCKTLFEPLWEKAYTQIANCNNILKHLERNRGLFPEGNYEIVEAKPGFAGDVTFRSAALVRSVTGRRNE